MVGTQSLAVTIRVLMDENLSGKKKIALLFKEMKIGFLNGASLAIMALVFLGVYIHLFKHYAWISSFLISGCVGISLIVAMVISSLVERSFQCSFIRSTLTQQWLLVH